ncbi:MAG: hypothetical protein MR304_11895 [Eubacterium sp.]|nr:hypothetical protein [Eubacterium sp.]
MEMEAFLKENKSFQSVYEYVILLLSDREELIEMFSDFWENEDIAASINLTNESIIKRMKKENEDLEDKLGEQEKQIQRQQTEIEQLKEQLQKVRSCN